MTQPRMFFPGTTYLVTHTVRNRQFLLNPSPAVNQILEYCVFRAAKCTRVEIHALSIQSNHIHMVVTDHDAVLSDFMHLLGKDSGKCLVEHYGDTHPEQYLEGIWSSNQFGAAAIIDAEALYKELLYTWMNPVQDGMVKEYRKWPGLASRPGDWAKPSGWATRPEYNFCQQDEEWARVETRYTVPPMLRDQPVADLIENVEHMLRTDHRKVLSTQRRFKGVKAILATDPFDSPSQQRPKGNINPTAVGGHDRARYREAKTLVRRFREAYRAAWKLYSAGIDTIFPAGTLMMRRRHGVQCEDFSLPWCVVAPSPG